MCKYKENDIIIGTSGPFKDVYLRIDKVTENDYRYTVLNFQSTSYAYYYVGYRSFGGIKVWDDTSIHASKLAKVLYS